MNFDLTEEQKEIQKAVDAFTKGEFDKEAILELERNHQFPFPYLKKRVSLDLLDSLSEPMAVRDMESLKMR